MKEILTSDKLLRTEATEIGAAAIILVDGLTPIGAEETMVAAAGDTFLAVAEAVEDGLPGWGAILLWDEVAAVL